MTLIAATTVSTAAALRMMSVMVVLVTVVIARALLTQPRIFQVQLLTRLHFWLFPSEVPRASNPWNKVQKASNCSRNAKSREGSQCNNACARGSLRSIWKGLSSRVHC